MSKRIWYEKYLPFVARSPEMQVRWIEAALRKGTLSPQEITPYIRLLLGPDGGEDRTAILRGLLGELDEAVVERLLAATEIYDVPNLFRLLPAPTLEQIVIAVTRQPPPYEEAPELIIDKVFQAVFDFSETLLEEAARRVMAADGCPAHFPTAYERFKEIKADEKLLSALYPKAIM
ncbi:MAG: hypothetical protein ACOY3Z_05000 [Thermodesulfobacteriota bacterium]